MYLLATCGVLSVYLLAVLMGKVRRNSKAELLLFFLIVFALITRLSLGSDQPSYQFAFQYMFDDPEGSYWYWYKRNPGFYGMNLILTQFIRDYRWYAAAVNFICLGLCSYTILKNSRNILFSALLFIGMGYLEVYYARGIRQMLAMSLYLFAYYQFLRKDRYLLYELFCILALGFHETVLPVLFLPLLKPAVKAFRQKPVRFCSLCLCICVPVALLVTLVMPRIIPLLGLDWQYWHIISYLTNVDPSVLGIGMECVFGAGILIVYLLSERENVDDFTVFSVVVFLFSVFLYLAFCVFSLLSRVTDTMQIIVLVLLPNLLESIVDKRKQAMCFCAAALLNAFLLFMDLRAGIPRINDECGTSYTVLTYPYISVLDEQGCEELLSHYYYYSGK